MEWGREFFYGEREFDRDVMARKPIRLGNLLKDLEAGLEAELFLRGILGDYEGGNLKARIFQNINLDVREEK